MAENQIVDCNICQVVCAAPHFHPIKPSRFIGLFVADILEKCRDVPRRQVRGLGILFFLCEGFCGHILLCGGGRVPDLDCINGAGCPVLQVGVGTHGVKTFRFHLLWEQVATGIWGGGQAERMR